MLFAYVALLLAEKGQDESNRRRALLWGMFAGMAAYLAFGTRTVGIVLVPSILICDGLRRRRLGLASAVLVAVFLVGVAVQKCLLVVEGSYLDQLVFDPVLFAQIALSLVRALGYFVENGYSNAARLILYACLLAPAFWSVLARMRGRWTVWEPFALFNCMILVFWPAAAYEKRFLLPILPLFFLWAGEGLHRLESTSLRRLEMPAAAVLALAMLLSYAGWYSRMDLGAIHNGVNSPQATALFDWVQQQTDRNDLFLFQKPRAFALYTGRRALAHHAADDPQRLAHTIHKHGVTHLVVYHSSPFPVFQKSGRLVETLLAGEPAGFDTVYENAGFRVYRLHEGALASR